MSDTYTKLFRSIAASTIVSEPLATRWLWVTLLSQCDRTGCVYGSIPGLARMANITLPEVEDALQRLQGPDAYSRTKDHEGRRLETVDGGWRLLNYAKYDAMRNEAERRESKRAWDRKNRPSGWKRTQDAEADAPEQSGDSPTVRQEAEEVRQSDPISHLSSPISHPPDQKQASSAPATPSPAGLACLLMRQAGCTQTNPSHPDLLAALAAGVTPEALADTVAEAIAAGVRKPFAYAITTARGRHAEGARPVITGPPRIVPAAPLGKTAQAINHLEEMKRGLAQNRTADRVPEIALLGSGSHPGG